MKHCARSMMILATACCAPAGANAQPHAVRPEGTEAFQGLLHASRLKPITSLAELQALDSPAETLIIVFGTNEVLEQIHTAIKGFSGFQQQGGAILIATDRDSKERLAEFDFAISGKPVVDFTLNYRGLQSCPRLGEILLPEHPIFQGIRGTNLATNRPSFMQIFSPVTPEGFATLARFGADSMVNNRVAGGKVLKRPPPYMVAAKDPDRVLLIAGHGIFMNMLLAQPDNDNMMFAFNCVRWLSQAPDGGKRKYALFVENGRIITDFDTGLIGTPPLPIPPVEVLNRMLSGLEKENFFNRLLAEFTDRNQILRGVLISCSVMLLLYAGWRLMAARQRSEAAVPLPRTVATTGDGEGLLTRRQQAMAANGNFAEAAAGLVRSFFAEYAPAAVKDTARGGKRPPDFAVSGSWWGRSILRREAAYLWRLSTEQAGPVSGRQLRRLPAVLDHVADALQQGRLIIRTTNGG